MDGKRPTTREDAEELMSRIRHAMESGADEWTGNVAGADVAFSRDAAGGLTFGTPDGTVSSRLFPAAESRPPDYPDTVPFMRNEPVTVTLVGDSVSLAYVGPGDSDALFADLNRQTAADGWDLTEESELAGMDARQAEYVKGELARSILGSGFMVSLIEKRR